MRKNGFTLTEVLLASTLFISVAIVAIGTFTNATKVESQTRVIREVAQGARFSLEAVAREVRLGKSFDILSDLSGTHIATAQDTVRGAILKVTSTDPITGASVTRIYTRRVENGLGGIYVSTDNGLNWSSLTTGEVNVTAFSFEGAIPSSTSKKQPFVTISLDIESRRAAGPKVSERAKQSYRTTVTIHDYNFKP